MKIFLLTNLETAGYGETRAMVIIAATESLARHFASMTEHSHSNEPSNGYGDEGRGVWESQTHSSCRQIGEALPRQEMGVVLTDFVYD